MTSFDQCVRAPNGRFDGIERPYSPDDVLRLRGSVPIEHSLARRGALRLWELLRRDEPVRDGSDGDFSVRTRPEDVLAQGWTGPRHDVDDC